MLIVAFFSFKEKKYDLTHGYPKIEPISAILFDQISRYIETIMNFEYCSSDEEDIYMKTDIDEEEISDIGDLRSELDKFQQVHFHCKDNPV